MILKSTEAMHASEALSYLTDGNLFEIRILRASKPPIVGYFESVQQIPEYPAENAFFTIHTIHEGLICRAPNRFLEGTKATSMDDIVRHRWLMIDIDPRRPSGIPASPEERQHAQNAVRTTIKQLKPLLGDRTPAILDTGNGYHLFYPLASVSAQTLAAFYRYLRTILTDTPEIIYDIGKIPLLSRVPGTLNRKGYSYKDRVHRPVQLLRTHQGEPITETELAQFIPVPTTQKVSSKTELSDIPSKIETILEYLNNNLKTHEIPITITHSFTRGERIYYALSECAFHPHHQQGHASLIQEPNGFIRYHCFSSDCRRKLQEIRLKNPYFPLPPPHNP